jgi:FAD synthetase
MKTRSTSKNGNKKQKLVRVLAQGTFDLLHPGHLHYLNTAKKFGNHLTVIVARDATVKRVKHHETVFPESIRVKMIGALRVVDRAVLGEKGDLLKKVVELRPDVIVLGYDQHVSISKLKNGLLARGLSCKIVRAAPYSPRAFKSTKWKEKIAHHLKQKTPTKTKKK